MDEQSTGSQAVQCQVHAVREDTLLLGGAGEEQYLSIFPIVKLKGMISSQTLIKIEGLQSTVGPR